MDLERGGINAVIDSSDVVINILVEDRLNPGHIEEPPKPVIKIQRANSSPNQDEAPLTDPVLLLRSKSAPTTSVEVESAQIILAKNNADSVINEDFLQMLKIAIPSFSVKQTFNCNICLENVAKEELTKLSSCSLNHPFCRLR